MSEAQPPLQQAMLVHVTSLDRSDASTQTQTSISSAAVKQERLEVLLSGSGDQEQPEVPEPPNTVEQKQLAHHPQSEQRTHPGEQHSRACVNTLLQQGMVS